MSLLYINYRVGSGKQKITILSFISFHFGEREKYQTIIHAYKISEVMCITKEKKPILWECEIEAFNLAKDISNHFLKNPCFC